MCLFHSEKDVLSKLMVVVGEIMKHVHLATKVIQHAHLVIAKHEMMVPVEYLKLQYNKIAY